MWIEQGAKDDSSGAIVEQTWWSLRPLTRPAVPAHADARTPIDAFILDKLTANGLMPSKAADPRTLIRRVYYDLHGLPPSPDEMEAFVNDRSPDAYDKLIDRLLASPRYGERWARHWLDVIHYGDSHGYDKDKPRPNAWPYRDYVIRALNEDKPYARFIQEQIAGDVLFPDDPQRFRRDRVPGRRVPGISSAIRSCAKARPKKTTRACSIATTWSRRPFPRSPA